MSLRHLAGRVQRIRLIFSQVSFVFIALAIEFLDELIGGAWMVALPLIQTNLHLSYTQIGLLSTVPNLVSSVIEPALGIWGDLGHRKKLILGGGLVFALATGLIALSQQWWGLLVAFTLLHPASGAFVSLTQAALMDSAPARHEQNMARWGVAGSLGSVAGSLAVSATITCGWGWRGVFGGIGLLALMLVRLLWHRPLPQHHSSADEFSKVQTGFWQGLCRVLRSLRQWRVLKWLILLEAAELMLDVFTTLLPLYLASVAQLSVAQVGLVITIWVGVGLVGDVLLIPVLARFNSLRYLYLTVWLTLFLLPVFLLVPNTAVKLALLIPLNLCRTGWYPILKGQLYSALPGQSSTVMTLGTIIGYLSSFIPVGLGLIADRYGLNIAMWLLLIGPIGLLIGIRQRESWVIGNR